MKKENLNIKTQLGPREAVGQAKKYSDGLKENQENGEQGGGIKILLVEDDPFLRDICHKKLVKKKRKIK